MRKSAKPNGDYENDEELKLKTAIFTVVKAVVDKFDPERLSDVDSSINKYDPESQIIARSIWRRFPYASERQSAGILAEIMHGTFRRSNDFVLCKKMATEAFALLPAPFRGAKIQLTVSIRSYLRHCSWCVVEIPKKEPAFVLYGLQVKMHRPRFCSRGCFENWDSIYWQQCALLHASLPRNKRESEKRRLRRQRKLLGYGWPPAGSTSNPLSKP